VLASAFLTTTAAAEHARNPDSAGRIPLTRNGIACLFSSLIIKPADSARRRCAGPPGADDTSTEPRHATTSGKSGSHKDNDPRLEY
jgi:hypothetical protein